MPRRKARQLAKYNMEVQIGGPFTVAPLWEVRLLVFGGEELVFSVEASAEDVAGCVELVQVAKLEIETALAKKKLYLPDMGEWNVTYCTPEVDKSH